MGTPKGVHAKQLAMKHAKSDTILICCENLKDTLIIITTKETKRDQ